MSNQIRLRRRSFLKGFGAAMALPALECMLPSRALAQSSQLAERFFAFYVPNGVRMDKFTPAQEGELVLSPILRPLAPLRDKVLVLSGLDKNPAEPLEGEFGGGHARGTSTFLTCAHPFKTVDDIQLGPSVDQVIAQQVGTRTRLPSLVLGCETTDNSGQCDFGYSCAYKNNISWSSPSTPVPRDTSPFLVFNRLFGSGKIEEDEAAVALRVATRRSVLDFVLDDSARLSSRLGSRDRAKLDQFQTSVREVERRITAAANQTCEAPDEPIESPANRDEHAKQLLELTALAMECDITRVGSFMLANGASGQSLPFLGFDDAHHEVSHHQGDDDKLSKYEAINNWSVSLFGYFMERLEERGLLDNAICVFGSEITDGNRHDYTEMPILVGGGHFQGGRHIRYPSGTPLANLYVSSVQAMGIDSSRFGDDGTAPLAGL